VILDEDEYLRLIDQMRISVPQEIKSARQVENERDAILAAAQAQAEAMVEAGRQKAEELASEHEVLRRSQEKSERHLQDAYEQAAAVRADADAYVLEVLERIQNQVDHFGRTIQNGIRLLRSDRNLKDSLTVEPDGMGETEDEAAD
jgi:cell division septum initiation protein DivIVA